jgi:hypothetical protein
MNQEQQRLSVGVKIKTVERRHIQPHTSDLGYVADSIRKIFRRIIGRELFLDLPVDHWSQINGYDVTHAPVSASCRSGYGI